MDRIIPFLDAINLGIDYLVAICFGLLLLGIVIQYTDKKIRGYLKKGDKSWKGVFLGIIMFIEMIALGISILWFPYALERAVFARFEWVIKAGVFRWILIFLILPLYLYLVTRKYSGRRGLYTALIVLLISLFGWQFQRWIGIIIISFPIYAILILLTYHLAQVILPSSRSAGTEERINKFKALLAYLLGTQFPVWISNGSAGREFETRIVGNNFNGGIEPGIVYTRSHQVAGISAGIEFTKVEGPGIIFTKIYDRPIALVDLRTQLRNAEFDATTKDGIAFKAILFAAFVIDGDDWPKNKWRQAELEQMAKDIKQNPYLAKGVKIDKKVGSYPYSTARIKSVLSIAGINANPKEGEIGPYVNWDDWTLKQVENAARQVLSQRTMNELWRPQDDQIGKSALDEIAIEIRKIVEPNLRRSGINLFACRIVNFHLPDESPIRKQQIDSWKTLWDQRITAALSEASAIREEEIEKAHAYAKSEILDAIADSIQKARDVNENLPRHVIAMYYIHAIEEIARKQPESSNKETKERLDMIKTYLLADQ